MKNMFAFCFAITCLVSFNACECSRVDCPIDEPILFQFLSKMDSTDLIVNGSYSISSLKITQSLIDSSSAGGNTGITSSGNEYIVFVTSHINVDSYFIQLDSLKPDTLKITTILAGGDKCCSSIPVFETLTLNGDSLKYDFANPVIQLYK
jgi:hypothetical protein